MRMIEVYPAGTAVVIGSKLFTAEDIIRFAQQFDPQPFHTDAEAAKQYVFGGLCASGWHTCAQWMRIFVDFLTADAERLTTSGIIPPKLGPSPGFRELSWLKPVYAGDTVTYSVTMLESRPLASRPGWLINTNRTEAVNQHGEPVLRFIGSVLEFE